MEAEEKLYLMESRLANCAGWVGKRAGASRPDTPSVHSCRQMRIHVATSGCTPGNLEADEEDYKSAEIVCCTAEAVEANHAEVVHAAGAVDYCRSCCKIAVAANHTATPCDPCDNAIPVSRTKEVGIAELSHKPAGKADYKSVEVDCSYCTW